METFKINEIEKEQAFQDLVDGYTNIFWHYLKSKDHFVAEGKISKDEVVILVKKTLELVAIMDEKDKESIRTMIAGLGSPNALTYYDLATKMGMAGGGPKTFMKNLRSSVFDEMERDASETSKEYIKSIL